MNDAQKLLALAERLGHKAILGREEFANDERHDPDGVYLCLDDGLQLFDPANNSEQALALLCWLGTQTDFSVCDDGRDFMLWDKHDDLLLSEPYSNPAEWRAAVRKAALRVA